MFRRFRTLVFYQSGKSKMAQKPFPNKKLPVTDVNIAKIFKTRKFEIFKLGSGEKLRKTKLGTV